MTMKCRLCENEFQSLENSHIIPEWMHKEIYDEKHRYIPISADNRNKLKIEQLGHREKLLCKNCENKFSRWEGNTKKDLVDFARKKSSFLDIKILSEKHTLIERVNHDYFKKCMLSILWRMSIAESKSFRAYDLGIFEKRIRVILNEDISLTTFDYPLMVQEVTIKGSHQPDLVMTMDKGRVNHKYIQQSFIGYGFHIGIIFSKHRFPEKYEILLLNDQGRIAIRKYDVMDIPLAKDLSRRFNDDDVIQFFNEA